MENPPRGTPSTPNNTWPDRPRPWERLARLSLIASGIAGSLGVLTLLKWGTIAQALPPGAAVLFFLLALVSAGVSQIARTVRGALDRAESARREAEEKSRALTAELERRVAERAAQVEDLTRTIEKTDRANRSQGEFLSRLSHELRTPLNAILGFAQLLQMDNLSSQQREHVELILTGGKNLVDLITHVQDFSRIDAGRLSLSPEPVHVSRVLQEAVDLVRPLAAEHHVDVQAPGLDALTQHVRADPGRLKQILLTLLSNAVKYSREGGVVTLACDARPDRRFRIKIRDTGRGLPPDVLDRLFIPFEQSDTGWTVMDGTRIGLALSKNLVEAMGGTMGAESVLGQGTTFWVELPLVARPEEQTDGRREKVHSAHTPRRQGEGTLLYIEDNLSNLRLVERIIARLPGVKLISAIRGRLGLDLAREHRPDLILLDLHLPDVPGDEVLRRLRQDAQTRHIPVVVISADANPGQVRRLLDTGARAYLTKPIDIAQLLALLQESLGDDATPPSKRASDAK